MGEMPYLVQECGAAAAAGVPLGREHEAAFSGTELIAAPEGISEGRTFVGVLPEGQVS
jgi:hypothetical protein